MVLQSLLPVLLVMLLGTALRHFRFLPDTFFQGLNKLTFWVGLPCLLFTEIAGAASGGGGTLAVSATLVLATLAVLPLGMLLAWFLGLRRPSARAFLQASYRGNLAYVGLPVIVFALSHDPAARSTATLAMAPTIPFFNVLSVLVLLKPGEGETGRRLLRPVAEMIRNPLIIACVLGLMALHTGLRLPAALSRAIDTTGRMGLPAALLALGAGLNLSRLHGQMLPAGLTAFLKVAVVPLLGWPIAVGLGLEGDLLTVALLLLSTPTAVSSYVMAEQMGADAELAAAAIVFSTIAAFPAMALVLLLT